jgi:iron complex outermembrane receptor protein
MSRFHNSRVRLAVLSVLCGASAQAARAADAPVALEEIVVTAEKREGNIQEIPLSIIAFSGAELAQAGIDGTSALANFTPGLTVQKEVIGKVVIRGVGTENYTVGSDPGVAIHKDGVYLARSSVAIFDFFDVERVEVLRGPQGTLYGRNATGGVINILSNEPTDEFGGYAKLDVGNYSKIRFEGALNSPFAGDKVQTRLSVLYAERDGFTENLFPGARARDVDQLDNQDLFAARAQVNFRINDDADLLLQGEWIRDDSLPPAFKYFDTTNAFWFNPPPGGTDQDLRDLREVAQGFEREIPGSGRTVPSVGQADQDGYLARLTWDLGSMRFTSLTGYREIDFSWINDGDGFDQFFVTYFQTDNSEQFTQEFQLASQGDAALQWILGAYYLSEDAVTFTGIPFIIGTPNDFILWDGQSDTDAYALYGQGTYTFTDRLRVTAGLRYNKDEKTGDLTYNLFGFLLEPDVALGRPPGTQWSDVLDEDWDAVTGRLAIDYDFTDDVMGYVSASRGYKSGGFNLLAAQEPYDPEYLWAYEAGVKTRWSGGRVIANVGAFYYDYSDMQVGKVVNLSATVVNAAAATIVGAEAELRALLTDQLEVSVGLAWLDTEYDEFVTEDPAWPGDGGCGREVAAPRTISLSGCQLPRAPELQAVVGASWTQPLSSGAELGLRADVSYRDDQYFTQFNRGIVSQESYALLGARATYTSSSERWYVTAYGDNLTDEDYFVTVLESGVAAPGTVVPQAVVGAPRTYGLIVGYNF